MILRLFVSLYLRMRLNCEISCHKKDMMNEFRWVILTGGVSCFLFLIIKIITYVYLYQTR